MEYNVTLPYPPIKVEGKNDNYANLILLNYAGYTSEFSAVTQYVYHEISFMDIYPDAAATIKGIAGVEMMHLQMLGEVIVKLGSDPGYWISTNKKKRKYWLPTFLNYQTDLKTAIKVDIESEKEAITQYKKTASEINDPNIKKLINRIILDEEYHIQLFINIYTKYILKNEK